MQVQTTVAKITPPHASASQVVNLAKYPIDNDKSDFSTQIARMREEFLRTGVLVLADFINPQFLDAVIREANEMAPVAFHNEVIGNAYLEATDMAVAENHPRRMVERTSLGAVAYDQMPSNSLIRQVYEWQPVMRFIAAILGKPVYQYACPMGALNISVMKDGDYLRWHFDQSDFVVSIALQDADQGGFFEYVHNIRTAGQENFDAVREVLQGDQSRVKRLQAKPGSMILFQGRYTMHRVTEIKGDTLRLMALLGYVDKPGMTSTDYLRQIRYGRTN
jgi:hypothetical protein